MLAIRGVTRDDCGNTVSCSKVDSVLNQVSYFCLCSSDIPLAIKFWSIKETEDKRRKYVSFIILAVIMFIDLVRNPCLRVRQACMTLGVASPSLARYRVGCGRVKKLRSLTSKKKSLYMNCLYLQKSWIFLYPVRSTSI